MNPREHVVLVKANENTLIYLNGNQVRFSDLAVGDAFVQRREYGPINVYGGVTG